MRKLLVAASLAALTIPSLAAADCYQQKQSSRIAGTLFGAGAGALIGGSVAGHGSKGAGAVIGAIGGGVIGNVAGGASVNCDGYYDQNGVWRAAGAGGYYDSDGRWVASPPSADVYGSDTAYVGGGEDLDDRMNRLDRHIRRGEYEGYLSSDDADNAERRLGWIRHNESDLANDHDGLTSSDRAFLDGRLDDLDAQVRSDWR